MQHAEFARLIDNIRTSGSVITTGTPVKVVLHNGDIVEVEEVKFSILDGGMIQIIAGPTDEDVDDEFDEKEAAEEEAEEVELRSK